jgi:hypothetical protein
MDAHKAIPPRQRGDQPKKFRVQEIEVGDLRDLFAYVDDTGHVSLRPKTQVGLEEWANSRDRGMDVHPLTQELREAIIRQMDVEQK